MPLRPRAFDVSKFNCLNPDLSGVRAFAAQVELARQLAKAESELSHIRNEVPEGLDLADWFQDQVRLLQRHAASPEERPLTLGRLCRDAQGLLRKQAMNLPAPGLLDVVRKILALYQSLDLTAFRTDFAIAFPQAKLTDRAERIKALEEKLQGLTQQAREAWPDDTEVLKTYFRGGTIPEVWEGIRLGPRNTPFVLATKIHSAFLQEWRQRAPLYEKPVTISGCDIDSLPEPRRTAWRELYGSLEFGQLKKAVRFLAYRAQPEVAAPEFRESLESVPPMFRPGKRGPRPKKASTT